MVSVLKSTRYSKLTQTWIVGVHGDILLTKRSKSPLADKFSESR